MNELLSSINRTITDNEKLNDCLTKNKIYDKNLLSTNVQCELSNSTDNTSGNSYADVHCHDSNIIPIPSVRKRPLVESSGEPDAADYHVISDLTSSSEEVPCPSNDNVEINETVDSNHISTKTRTKRVKLKMGGTSFRTVDKIWAAP